MKTPALLAGVCSYALIAGDVLANKSKHADTSHIKAPYVVGGLRVIQL